MLRSMFKFLKMAHTCENPVMDSGSYIILILLNAPGSLPSTERVLLFRAFSVVNQSQVSF